jgi:hypothetical protein
MIFDYFMSLQHDHLKQLKELHFHASCLVNDQPPLRTCLMTSPNHQKVVLVPNT